ncbi:MAG: hypothetical protein C0424_08935 [Sphingobacteriaceae bacterium]|nr:hypothetical protein [Sphingobacteriaceae bacterium]
MKKLIASITMFSLVALLHLQVQAQGGYKSSGGTSAGLRLGPDAGITLKHHAGSAAYEGILHLSDWFQGITVLYHFFHKPITADLPGLDWYAGAGGHLWNYRANYRTRPGWVELGSVTGIGVDFALGAQYNFPGAPINLSLDWKPALNIIGGTGMAFSSTGLSVRYRWR